MVVEADVSPWWMNPPIEPAVRDNHAARDIAAAIEKVEALRLSNGRFDRLIREVGLRVHLVYDHDRGSMLLAHAEAPDFLPHWIKLAD